MQETPATILEFWFSAEVQPLWFNATAAFDRQLTARFETLWRQAAAGEWDAWATTAEGALALVIILDQFPLNMFRQCAESFSTEARAREIATQAIDGALDQSLSPEQKVFLYLPFMHSENLADQARSVALFRAAGLQENVKFAEHHRDIVRRFGRFPHRNAPLGRESTAGEIAYLNSDEAFHG